METIFKLKNKLLKLTKKYVNLESLDNKEARDLKIKIDVILNNIDVYYKYQESIRNNPHTHISDYINENRACNMTINEFNKRIKRLID